MDPLRREVRTPADAPPMPEGGCVVHVHGPSEWAQPLVRALNAHYGILIDGTTRGLGEPNRETLGELLPVLARAGVRVSVMGPKPEFAVQGGTIRVELGVPPAGTRLDFYVEKG